MLKFLPLAFIPLIVFSVIAYFKFNGNSSKPSPSPIPFTQASSSPEATTSADKSPREVPKTLPASSPKPSSASSTNSDTRIKALEDTVFSLQQQIANLKAENSSTSQSSSTSKSPQYVYSLGTGGSATTISSWTTIDTISLTIDPANYPGYKDMVLEALISVYQGNGTAYAKLFNKSAGTAVDASEVSTSAYNYTWIASKPFTLTSGSKTFYPQLKTSTGYAAQIQDFRIKVNY